VKDLPGLPYFPRVKLVGIEPDAVEAGRLESSTDPIRFERVHAVAAWNKPGRLPLHVTANVGCSSLLPPIAPY
jgi:hypothetical protein